MPDALIELLVRIAHDYAEAYPWLPPIDPMFDAMLPQSQWCPYGTVEVAPWIGR